MLRLDNELISSIAVKRHPTFTVAKFMEHMRMSLNTTDWLVVADLSATKLILNGECIQLSVHFYGNCNARVDSSKVDYVNDCTRLHTQATTHIDIRVSFQIC